MSALKTLKAVKAAKAAALAVELPKLTDKSLSLDERWAKFVELGRPACWRPKATATAS